MSYQHNAIYFSFLLFKCHQGPNPVWNPNHGITFPVSCICSISCWTEGDVLRQASSSLCWLNVHLSCPVFSNILIFSKPARLCMNCVLWAVYIYVFKEQTASFLRCWQIIKLFISSQFFTDWSLREGCHSSSTTSLPPIPTGVRTYTQFTHSQRTCSIVLPRCTLPFLMLSCCLCTSSIEFLNRICCGGREAEPDLLSPPRLHQPPFPRRQWVFCLDKDLL